MLGASESTLIEMFTSHVRSNLELAVPFWAGALTQSDKNSIERVQKIALKIVQGNSYFDYIQSLDDLELETLDTRRDILCLKFTKKCLKNKRFKQWFPQNKKVNSRSFGKYIVPNWKTKRYLISSIPNLINILNQQ